MVLQRPPANDPNYGQNRFNSGNDPNLMGPDYFKDQDQLTWADDAHSRYNREHGIDTNTGGITGPLGPVPAGLAQQWQAAHDQAVWNARNRMSREALRMAQGGVGLMSSYRSGGGASVLSGGYQNLGQMQLQRAQMMQPLDLLGDYRRDTLARAAGAGRDEAAWGAGLQAVGAILSIAAPGIGTAAGAALAAGGGYLAGQGASKQNAAMARAGAVNGGTFGGGGGGAQAGAFAAALQAAQGIGRSMGGQGEAGYKDYDSIPPPTPGSIPQTPRADSPMYNWPMERSPNAPQDPYGATMQSQGAGGAQAGQQKSMGQQPGQQGAGLGGMPSVVGTDGVFSPTAYAAHGMASNPVAPIMQHGLNAGMAMKVSQDPSWSIISMAWDKELSLRTLGAA